ncbi:uncharacterized protein LOC129728579 [Wyeomyia smithii]|uniref:uncharacterized protein LOC129728579 n=1 Tax=Wyeomyia smithii TaxID=174621 RepID=UPI002467D038|nr:uncharacterized protein LOC129728579 [Wyeomyia smithii]
MANVADSLLEDLAFSTDSLEVLQQCGIQLYELLTYSLEDFKNSLQQSSVEWNYGKIFGHIDDWRKRNKSQILQALSAGKETDSTANNNRNCEEVSQGSEYLSEERLLSITDGEIIPKNHACDSGDFLSNTEVATAEFTTKKNYAHQILRAIPCLLPACSSLNGRKIISAVEEVTRNHGGKVANKIGNLKQKKRKSEVQEREHLKLSGVVPTIDNSPLDPETTEAVNWLALNQEPWSIVLDKWTLSFLGRLPLLKSEKLLFKLFSIWPHYKSSHGYQLVDIDYKLLNVRSLNEIQKLNSITAAITTFIAKKAIDPSAVKLLKYLTDCSVNQDTRLCALLLALNTVLPPIIVSSKFKPKICTAQEDTIIFVSSHEQLIPQLQSVYASYVNRKLPISPKFVAVGVDLETLTGRFFVYHPGFCFELSSAARAIDVLIKTTHLFGLSYPKLSKLVWQFIGCFVYGIDHQESYASVNRLSTFLKQIENTSVNHV